MQLTIILLFTLVFGVQPLELAQLILLSVTVRVARKQRRCAWNAVTSQLIPRPSAASFLFAYVAFEPLSGFWPLNPCQISWLLASLSDKGSKATYANKNEAADGLAWERG